MTPENIARLPPKLRQRLLQRGILKPSDVEGAVTLEPCRGGNGGTQVPSLEVLCASCPDVSGENSTSVAIQTLAVGLSSCCHDTSFLSDPTLVGQVDCRRGADVGTSSKRLPSSPLGPSSLGTPPLELAPGTPPVELVPRIVRQVYTAEPVLHHVKRTAEEEAQPQPVAKRPEPHVSPAMQSALEVTAQDTVPPVWIYKDGLVKQVDEAHPKPSAPPPVDAGPTLPPSWVRVPHENEFYFWNTATGETSWEHPGPERIARATDDKKALFKEEHRVLWSDLGRVIGKQGINLKIIKMSIGCDVKIPRRGGKDGKGDFSRKGTEKGKDKGKGKEKCRRGTGTGEKIDDDEFCTIQVTAETRHMAMGGKRCIQVMLGYGRSVERALQDLGVEIKQPVDPDVQEVWKKKEELDPVDPAAYSGAPQGNWSRGLHTGRKREAGDAKTANAERF